MSHLKKAIRIADSLINFIIILCFIPVLLYGIYGIWDSKQVYKQADPSIYHSYRPTIEEDSSLEALQKMNPEVIGWISVDNTNIDYPLLHSQTNSKYVNTNVEGEFSLSGSIFLDCRNTGTFTDVNNVIYGHHMQKNAMFGELSNFEDPTYFDQHPNGRLFYDNEWHDIDFFAFLYTDAYDPIAFNATLTGSEQAKSYYEYIKEKAINFKTLPFEQNEHYIALSTCATESTNGRYILVGQIKQM